ncbi:MAG: phosphatidate cytidylyltransferase, partial [Planctomycetes bacterium]|nr:phosphatidate cytidylyltransferase [Planctomycetota bacterium]
MRRFSTNQDQNLPTLAPSVLTCMSLSQTIYLFILMLVGLSPLVTGENPMTATHAGTLLGIGIAGGLAELFSAWLQGLIGAAGVALLVVAADNGLDWWTRTLALLVPLPFLPIILRGQTETGLRDWLWTLGGLMYVGFLGSHLILLRDTPNGLDWVLLALFATFATDTSAYFVGRLLGRTKIAPSISPGKTLEGSLAGFAAGLATV